MRQEDFGTQSDKYVEMRKSFGVNDTYALKEIGEAHYQGAEYGYTYAVDKVVEYLLSALKHELGYFATGDFVTGVIKFMEEL